MDSHLKKPSTNSVGNWTPHEDEIILRYVYDKGKSDEHMMWGNLSETLNGRSGKSCRERWFNHLDPKIKRTEWSQEEQWVLFILRNQSSEKWSLISKRLMGRTDNAVKNYWNSRLKKRIDSMQHAVNQHFERKRKQKIAQMTQSTNTDQQANSDHQNKAATNTIPTSEQVQNLSQEQKMELEAYMDRIKAEYLQKILEQVNNQNVEYFENLACEYTLQYQLLIQKQSSPGDTSLAAELDAVMFAKQCISTPMENDEHIRDKKSSISPFDAPKINGSQIKDNEEGKAAQSGLLESRQGNNDTQACDFDGDEGMLDCERSHTSQLPFFMKNPEVIKMHLDILYKSITFLSELKITAKIEQYKQAKEQKKREEEERLQMQMQIKKQRGRAANNQQQQNNYPQQANRKDRKTIVSGERDQQSFNNNRSQPDGEFQKPGQMARQGYTSNCGNQNNKDNAYSSERYEQAKSKNIANDNKQGREGQSPYKHGGSSHYYDQKADKDGAVRSSSYGNMIDGSKKCSGQIHECNCGYNNSSNKKQSCQQSHCHNQSKLQKDGQIIAHRLCNSKSQNQALLAANQNQQHVIDGMMDDDDSFWSQSSFSNCSVHSKTNNKERVQADGSTLQKDSHKLSPKSLIIKRMLKKLRKQKRQYKLMDKIFFSEKAEKLSNIVDPYLKRPISPERMQYDSFFAQQQTGSFRNTTNSLTEQAFKTDQDLMLNINLTKNIEESNELTPGDLCPKTLKANSKNDMAPSDNKKKIVPGNLGIKKSIQKQNKAMISVANNKKIKDFKKLKNNCKNQTDKGKIQIENLQTQNQQAPVLSTQPVAAIYPFDIGVAPAAGQVHSSQPQMIPNQPFMAAPPPAFEMAGDLFNGIPNTTNSAQTSSLFGNTYNGYQSQMPANNMLPFGIPSHIGSNPVPQYQTGSGNTFFHQGCNIQYTDVKTFTTTIHLHCGGSADGKQPHQDFCPEAKNGTGCKQTMHFTSMLPSQQYIQHPNISNGATQSFQSGPVPMMFAAAQKPNSYPASSSLQNEYSQSQNNNECGEQQMGQYQRTKEVQNEFVIDEHQIGQPFPKSQMNNQSSSYHGSSKTNARSHSKRFGMRSKRSMMQRTSGNKNNTYRTQNFLNQTMTQINKGKDRELNPLYNRRSAALSSTLANNKFGQPYNFNFNQVAQSINQPEMNMQMAAEVGKSHQGVEQERASVSCGNGQFQPVEKQTLQSTPITSKSNPNMFQSPAPTQSFARVAFHGQTPTASAFMGNDLGKQVYPQTALRPGIQGSASATQFGHSNFYNTESKKMGHQQMNPLTMTGRASVSTAATSLNPASTPHFSSGVKNMPAQMMPAHMVETLHDSQMNQNEFSSDILMKVKSGNNISQHQQNCQLDYSQARLVNSNSSQMAAAVAVSGSQKGVYPQKQSAPQTQVPIVSAFQF